MNPLKDSDTNPQPLSASTPSDTSPTEDPALMALPTDSLQIRAEKMLARLKAKDAGKKRLLYLGGPHAEAQADACHALGHMEQAQAADQLSGCSLLD